MTDDVPWTFEETGLWFANGKDAAVDLGSYAVQRRLLACLLEERLASPGRVVPRERLLAAAWPGERILARAAENRLKVTLNRLRSSGLGPLIETGDGGYLLRPDVSLNVVARETKAFGSSFGAPPCACDVDASSRRRV